MPSPGIVLIMVGSLPLFFGLSAWGWGGAGALLAHPARAGAFVVIVLATVAVLFSGLNLDGFRRADTRMVWVLVPVTLASLLLAWLPAYADRRDLWVLDGGAVRYLGLGLLAVGCVLRIGPMFVLGRRFTWPLATQEEHRLVTTGFYRVIRHPSYLGALLGGAGWALVFRCGIGVLLIAALVVVFSRMIDQEEALLLAEFGDAYVAYRKRTWRLVPFLY
jgi:protein-S-isoprenylcysteine O-methyltransferase Ste14